ncbi:N-acetylmuramoyl-L-alanine amidase [Candidatus Chloroploca sp. M-50]|uniref:N-acetylmuramoyl-L-alanine amidase n=1 Tax=Candidatus Chloroploca mongolica TaxID=2528176 RepID=A0ABS4D4S2_9CHLR|nr:N-acetylmuramoyl-L-alanine amidase [Candidatus Chloroploca mongolica]MBP1464438.1 N-acetylmuramoyl-L-alanine amidase [Candidatus Chloroploca mongolica]
MDWPSVRDYDEALQSIDLCFPKQPKLATAELISADKFGLPMGSSGSSAVVYKIRIQEKDYALRCFTSEVNNHRERYQLLHEYVHRQSLSSFVKFQYLVEGISVNHHMYPVLLMDWANGKSLSDYIADSLALSQTDKLRGLVQHWFALYFALRQINMAHGDLQHGNILIDTKGIPHLIDYDGIYTPTMASYRPKEFGHRHYQHPERERRNYYAEDMDSFSVLVVAISLLALAERPNLWRQFYHAENLIFEDKDFTNAGETSLWHELRHLSSEVQQLAMVLQRSCSRPITTITPEIDEALKSISKPICSTISESDREYFDNLIAVASRTDFDPPPPTFQPSRRITSKRELDEFIKAFGRTDFDPPSPTPQAVILATSTSTPALPRKKPGVSLGWGFLVVLALVAVFFLGRQGNGDNPPLPATIMSPPVVNTVEVEVVVTKVAVVTPTPAQVRPTSTSSNSSVSSPTINVVRRPNIISRSTWGALPATGLSGRQNPRQIVLSHDAQISNDSDDVRTKLRAIQRFHQQRGWPDISWHFIVDRSGNIFEGRSPDDRGDTNYNFNTDGMLTIGVLGDYDRQNPNQAQLNTIIELMAWLCQEYNIPTEEIYAHSYFANQSSLTNPKITSPGRNFDLPEIQRMVQAQLTRR